MANVEILGYAPSQFSFALGELGPKIGANSGGVGQDEAKHLAAANKAVIPTKIVIQQQIERGSLAGAKRLNGALLDFSFQATAAQRAVQAAVGIKQRLGPDLLRAGSFDAGDERQRDGFAAAGSIRQGFKDDVLHALDLPVAWAVWALGMSVNRPAP